MPRSPEENARIRADKREQILRAGLSVFAEHGLADAKMSDIAKAGKVSYGLVYNYFASKEEMFIELVNRYIASGYEVVDTVRSIGLAPLERIKEIFVQLFSGHSNDMNGALYYRLMLQLNFYPHLWEKLIINDLSGDPVFQFLCDAVKEGQERGDLIDADSQEIVLLLGYIAMSSSLNGQQIFEQELKAASIADLIVRMIKK